jgi:hypothetical protein
MNAEKRRLFSFESAQSAFFSVPKTDSGKESHIGYDFIFDGIKAKPSFGRERNRGGCQDAYRQRYFPGFNSIFSYQFRAAQLFA